MGRGVAVFAGTPPEVIRASSRGTEGLGYSPFWTNYPGSIDGLTALTSIAIFPGSAVASNV